MIFRTLSERTTIFAISRAPANSRDEIEIIERTFLFTNILERKRQAGVFALDNADLSKGTLSDNAEEAEVVKVN
jgi:hypothetical protein